MSAPAAATVYITPSEPRSTYSVDTDNANAVRVLDNGTLIIEGTVARGAYAPGRWDHVTIIRDA